MASDLQSFSDLFDKSLFRIPDYQRGYAWRKEQLADFWDDLVNLQEDRFHYTGLLSLKEIGDDESSWHNDDKWLANAPHNFELFHVVDGQQRLTTFSILMHELIKFVKELPNNQYKSDDEIYDIDSEMSLAAIKKQYILEVEDANGFTSTSYLFGYETDNPSSQYLKHKIFEKPGGSEIRETYYTTNLKIAKSFFANEIRSLFGLEDIEGIQQLYQKLTKRLMFNLHKIHDDYDVFVAFETMNNRGKRLTTLELLKNRLIYLTTLYSDSDLNQANKNTLRSDINDAWKEVYFQLGRNQKAPLSDDDFLRAHWITYFEYTRKKRNAYVSFLLDDKFSAKNVFEKHADIKSVEQPEEVSDSEPDDDVDEQNTDAINDKSDDERLIPGEIQEYVEDLQKLSRHWYYSFFSHDAPKDTYSDEERLWIKRLNRVGMGYFRPLVAAALATKTDSDERVELFKAIERFIFVMFRVGRFHASYKSSVYYRKSREVRKRSVKLSSVTQELNQLVDDNADEAIATFTARTTRRFKEGNGFYDWRSLRYFLYEYEYDLSEQSRQDKLGWEKFTQNEKDKLTIEHILPQTRTNEYWHDNFEEYTEEQIRYLSGSLGNLLPLLRSINSSLQNHSFPDKKNRPQKRGYNNGSHSEIEVSKNDDWTAETILKRGLRLLGFMEDRWNIEIACEEKLELLHIDFVKEAQDHCPDVVK